MLAVRAPLERADVCVIILGDLLRLATLGNVVEIDLGLASGIPYESDVFPIWAPVRTPVVGIWRLRYIPGYALPNRDIE